MKNNLRSMLDKGRLIMAPGAGDALTAKLIERCGFPCVSMSGYQVAANLGYPDVGLVTLTEMVSQATRICATVDVPVIVDGDNGHGNAVNVIRTVQEFERAGAAAMHLEDQSLPKKCGHMQGHVLISTEEMCGKIGAATDARVSNDFWIIARSDAIQAISLDDAIERGKHYKQAGADAIMVMGPRSVEDLRKYRESVDGPLVVTIGSWPFNVTADELQSLGYQLVLYPLTTMRRAIVSISECLRALLRDGSVDHFASDMVSMDELHGILGLEEILRLQNRYIATKDQAIDTMDHQ